MPEQWPNRGQWLAFAAFVIIPLFLLLMIGLQYIEETTSQTAERFTRIMETVRSNFHKATDPVTYLSPQLKEIVEKTQQVNVDGPISPAGRTPRDQELVHNLESLKVRFPELFTISVLRPPGLPDLPFHDHGFSSDEATLLRQAYAGKRRDDKVITPQTVTLRRLLGPLFNPFSEVFFRLQESRIFEHRRYYFLLKDLDPRGSMVVGHLHSPANLADLLLQDAIRRTDLASLSIRAALLSSENPDPQDLAQLGSAAEDFGPLQNLFATDNLDQQWFNHRLWMRVPTATDTHLHLVGSPPQLARLDTLRRSIVIAFTLLLGFSFTAFLIAAGRPTPIFISVRWKVPALFLFSTIVPLLAFGFTQFQVYHRLADRLEQQVYREHERAIQEMDKNLPHRIGLIESAIAQKFRRLSPDRPTFLADARHLYKNIHRELAPFPLELANHRGDVESIGNFKTLSSGISDMEMRAIRGIAKEILFALDPDAATGMPGSDRDLLGAALESSGIPYEMIVRDLLANLGRMHHVAIGDTLIHLYLYPFFNQARQPRYLSVLAWKQENIESRIISALEADFRPPFPESAFQSFNRKDFLLEGLQPILADAYQLFLQQNRPLHQRMRIKEKQYLVSCLRPAHIFRYNLMLITPVTAIAGPLREGRRQTALQAVLLLLLSLALSMYLTHVFLWPVGHLDRGIAALAQRRFDTRVPILNNDELGAVSAAFNRMMEGMADLEIARIVQENLFPAASLTAGSWTIEGSCHCAVQVGGDYYDYLILPDGRLLIVIGDVSGHGIPAAIVMGTAKGLIKSFSRSALSPEAILERMNTVLHASLRGKKFMTFFLGFLDPRTGILECASAGHCYPLLVRAGTVTDLVVSGLPLGARRKTSYRKAEFSLQPGDTLLFYTDGLPEALVSPDQQLGYQPVHQALPTLLRSAPRETLTAIFDWHQRTVMAGPQDDDITLVALQSCPSSPTPAMRIPPQ
jgi:HAMP domain-containing protein